MSIRFAAALLTAGVLLGGCSQTSSDNIGPTDPSSGNNDPGTDPGVSEFRASFVPLSGVLPFPTDLYFNGSTDGTLNIPATPFLPNAAALNALDGFSTVASATARFSGAIDEATLSPSTVFMFEVDVSNTTKATTGFRRPLTYGTHFTARVADTIDSGGATLEIVPLVPLTPSTGGTNVGYLVVLTNGILDVDGNAATPDADYATIQTALAEDPATDPAEITCPSITNASLNGICRLTGAHLAIAGAVGVNTSTVVLSFSFSTQATADTMSFATQLAQANPPDIAVVATGLDLSALNPALPPVADVYVGTLGIPYYLDPAAPLTTSWQGPPFTAVPGAATTTHLTRFNPVPIAQATPDIPLFVTVPNAASGQAKPGPGWPVVIFQHGITGNRTQSAAIAATYAAQGFVVAAIDIPLHGITDTASPLYQAGAERTFDLDLVDNATGAAGPDGAIDSSGTHFINLTSLLTSRDNLRQAAIDIIQLALSLGSLDLDGDTIPDIDANRIHFAGLSLGGIVGTVATAQEVAWSASSYLSAPGGGLANLLRDSAALGPRVIGGLEAAGLVEGTTLFEQFFRDAQAVVDSGDAINYIAAAIGERPVLVTQVINDLVVPNSATQRLVNAALFTKASAAGPTPVATGAGTWVHFTSGSHGSLLDPTASLAVTTEMQTHAASLAASDGTAFVIANPALLEP